MSGTIEKQILEWKEELHKQIRNRDQAKKVFDESTNNINVLQGGIQFGEALLRKSESLDQELHKEEQDLQSEKAPSNS
tara:strand:+ start:110 stop:343 length:234 start_codon:yes stop_codon:yes gene_type:complete